MEPETIVIKPTLKCVGNCEGCGSRQSLYSDIQNEKVLDIDDYKKLFVELQEMGMKKLVISGGEPTLYQKIYELLELASSFDFSLSMNTTGYGLTEQMIQKLDAINFSLNGYNNEIDSKIRNKVIFNHTIAAIKLAKKQGVCVNVNCIVNKYNYDSLDKLLELVNE